jgi:hypothetical protein
MLYVPRCPRCLCDAMLYVPCCPCCLFDTMLYVPLCPCCLCDTMLYVPHCPCCFLDTMLYVPHCPCCLLDTMLYVPHCPCCLCALLEEGKGIGHSAVCASPPLLLVCACRGGKEVRHNAESLASTLLHKLHLNFPHLVSLQTLQGNRVKIKLADLEIWEFPVSQRQ